MRFSRALFPLLLALTLLFAQQAGVMHALSHTLAEQGQDQQNNSLPHSQAACGQCAAYTQMGSALNGAVCLLPVIAIAVAPLSSRIPTFRPIQPLAVVARGPPTFLQTFV